MASQSNEPIKILHCIFSLEVGGAETMLVDIINGQVERKQHVTLIIVNNKIDQQLLSTIRPEVNIIKLMREPGSNPIKLMWILNREIHKLNPDIIHVHNPKLCFLIRQKRNKMLMTVHSLFTSMKYSKHIRMVAISEAVRNYILSRIPNAKVSVIGNGIKTADIAVRPSQAPAECFKLVQVGRLDSKNKGQDILIKAIAILNARQSKNVSATFIGDGADRKELQALATKLRVNEAVFFDGLHDRNYIYSHLQEYDAMCHPSRSEGFGLTVAEGMAAGLPLLLTEGDGPWEVADNGRLCESFKKDNPQDCADAIERLMNDYNSATIRATIARQYVTRYDISHTVDNYIKLYRNIIKGIDL
jgi:glycosyltransferase involved in cell wall biosynthesis